MTTSHDDPLITRRQAREKYFGGIHSTTLWRWEASGKLPPAIRVSERVRGWRASTLNNYLAACGGEKV